MSEQLLKKQIKNKHKSDKSEVLQGKTYPLSRTVRESVCRYIKENNLLPGEALPTEASFMKMLGVSRSTIREALTLLEQEKLIYRIQGKGTFVNRTPFQIESGLEKLESITDTIKGFGLTPGTRWVAMEIKAPEVIMAEKLKLETGERVITFKRIRTADDNIAAYCVDTVPLRYFRELPLEIENESLFHFLEENLGIIIESAVTDIIPTLPTEEMIKELELAGDEMFLLLQQVHYDKKGIPVIFSKDYFKADFFKFRINRLR